ncbi:MAG: hypothetical protein PHW04_04855 [Candidatus Wallbacteria bacterium]|nr:hypothetical protein [Candidatus Wallbacteria bacterium]
MSRIAILLLCVLFIACNVSYAGPACNCTGCDGKKVQQKPMLKNEMLPPGNPEIMPLRFFRQEREIVGTEDGGIVILDGNRLFKFDKKLKPVAKAIVNFGPQPKKMMMERPQKINQAKVMETGEKCCQPGQTCIEQCRNNMACAGMGKVCDKSGNCLIGENKSLDRTLFANGKLKSQTWKQRYLNNLDRQTPNGENRVSRYGKQCKGNCSGVVCGMNKPCLKMDSKPMCPGCAMMKDNQKCPGCAMMKDNQKCPGCAMMKGNQPCPECAKMLDRPMLPPPPEMMGPKFFAPKMIATEDGGVVIMCCGQIFKFDKKLKQIGAAKIGPSAEFKKIHKEKSLKKVHKEKKEKEALKSKDTQEVEKEEPKTEGK